MTTRGVGPAGAQRGSVLLLMPAAVLIVLVLGAIAVDAAVAFLGEREAAGLAAASANDAAGAAVDEAAFRADGELRLDPGRVEAVVRSAIEGSSAGLEDVTWDVVVTDVDGIPAVRVTVRGTVRYVFASAIPGAPDSLEVASSATAVLRQG